MSLLQLALGLAADLLRARRDLVLENLALRQQLAVLRRKHPQRIVPRRSERMFWVLLTSWWGHWRNILRIVQPDTVMRWHRLGFRLFWRWKSSVGGRPRIDQASRALIQRLAVDNPLWGSPRIHGELLKLGYQISQRSVSRWMPKRPRRPRSPSWSTFLRNHAKDLVAIDFFVIVTASFRLLYGFVVISVERRRILHTGVTAHPTAEWTAREVEHAVSKGNARRLIRDRDSIYGSPFVKRMTRLGIEQLITAPRTPQQNAYAERVIGSIRRECLDHVVVLHAEHARRLLVEYSDYYNHARTHLALDKDAPQHRPVDAPANGPIVDKLRYLGGLHHRYVRRAA